MPRQRRTISYKTKSVDTSKRNTIFILWVLLVGVSIVVGAILLGSSDSGQIDVNSAIQTSNQEKRDSGDITTPDVNTVPEVFKNKPNGGLVPADGVSEPESQAQPQEEIDMNATPPIEAVEGSVEGEGAVDAELSE